MADNCTTDMCRLSSNSGRLNLLQSSGPVTGLHSDCFMRKSTLGLASPWLMLNTDQSSRTLHPLSEPTRWLSIHYGHKNFDQIAMDELSQTTDGTWFYVDTEGVTIKHTLKDNTYQHFEGRSTNTRNASTTLHWIPQNTRTDQTNESNPHTHTQFFSKCHSIINIPLMPRPFLETF